MGRVESDGFDGVNIFDFKSLVAAATSSSACVQYNSDAPSRLCLENSFCQLNQLSGKSQCTLYKCA